jgi:hypothetical protein
VPDPKKASVDTVKIKSRLKELNGRMKSRKTETLSKDSNEWQDKYRTLRKARGK